MGGAAGIVAVFVTSGSWRSALVTSFIFAIVSLSIVVVTGYAGQVSLAQLTLAGVGGFLLGPLSTDWGVPFPLAPILAALGATVIGVVVGIPALRIRGLPVAIVTLSLAVAVQAVWFQNTDLVGSAGKSVTEPKLFGFALGPGTGSEYPRPAFCLMVLVVLIGVAVGVALLRRSALGERDVGRPCERTLGLGVGHQRRRNEDRRLRHRARSSQDSAARCTATASATSHGTRSTCCSDSASSPSSTSRGSRPCRAARSPACLPPGESFPMRPHSGSRSTPRGTRSSRGVALVVSVIKNPDGLVGNIHRVLDRRRATPSEPAADSARAAPRAIPHDVAPSRRPGVALAVRDVTVRYGGVVAVDGVSFDVPRDAIVGLIGPNGAGKTSVIDAISGFCRYAGTVELDGQPLDGLAPFRRVRRGLGRTFQGIELWNELTVSENVIVRPGASKHASDHVAGVLELLGLDGLRDRPAGELSQGQRQLVSIARALVARPEIVLLDEPAAGLDSSESAWLAERLRDVRDAGTTVLLVDHDMNLVLNLCDHIEVLDFGRIIARGTPAEMRGSSVVADAYLGTTHAAPEVGVS